MPALAPVEGTLTSPALGGRVAVALSAGTLGPWHGHPLNQELQGSDGRWLHERRRVARVQEHRDPQVWQMLFEYGWHIEPCLVI